MPFQRGLRQNAHRSLSLKLRVNRARQTRDLIDWSVRCAERLFSKHRSTLVDNDMQMPLSGQPLAEESIQQRNRRFANRLRTQQFSGGLADVIALLAKATAKLVDAMRLASN